MKINFNIKIFTVIIVTIMVTIGISGCFTKENINAGKPSKDNVVIGITDPTYGFYPWWTSYDVSSISINHNIFDSLVSFDGLFRIKAELAESWNNPDNSTWRFRIRKNVKFHNGYELTADDVKYSIDIIKNNESNVLRDLLISINETKIIDDYTIDIITYKPCPILLNKLTDIFIVSKKYQQETTIKWPIGTGPYKISEFVENYHLVLERFDDYWKEKPDAKKATFKFIEDIDTRKTAFINGELDIVEGLQALDYDNLSKLPGIKLYMVTQPTVTYISFDFRENCKEEDGQLEKNPLSDIRVRKAIYHAINIDEIIERAFNKSIFAEPASQFVTPLIFGYNPNITRLPYNVTKSKELLNESGYSDGFNLVLDCVEEACTNTKICEVIDEQLSKVLNFSLNRLPIGEYYEKICSRNTSCYILGWMAATGDGGEIYDYMIRSVDSDAGVGTFNLGYYSNPEVDRIGEEITYMMEYEERLKLIQEGFEVAMEDIAWIPLLSSNLIYGVVDEVNWEPCNNMLISIQDITFN